MITRFGYIPTFVIASAVMIAFAKTFGILKNRVAEHSSATLSLMKISLSRSDGSTAEVIDEGIGSIHQPQSHVSTVGMERPGCDIARGKQGSVSIDFHGAIGPGARPELVTVCKGHRNIGSVLHPILAGMIRPHGYRLAGSVIHDVQQPGSRVRVARRFQDQAVLIPGCRVQL